MDGKTRQAVRDRAGSRCEYCRLPQHAVELTFHVEHVVPKQHGGGDDLDNLCLACDRCNLFKGPNLAAIDPVANSMVRLFHPRRDEWIDHFSVTGNRIVGKTASGRATAQLLQMNAERRQELRARLIAGGSW